MPTSLGIAITTFNSRDLVVRQIMELRRLTSADHELVVADDGSSDGTVPALRALGVTVIAGANRGVAWNKNRGLFHLLNKTDCRVILLLDDDILPVVAGWESDWIEVTARIGHVNYMVPSFVAERVVAGSMTVASPGLATSCFGPLIGCTREGCAYVGYFDVRFGRWGFEHVDFTNRFMRAGYGVLNPDYGNSQRKLYAVLSSGVRLLERTSTVSAEEKAPMIERGRKVLIESQEESIYRCPWVDDDQMQSFRTEMNDGIDENPRTDLGSPSVLCDAKSAETQSSSVNATDEGFTKESTPVAPSRSLFMIHIPKTAGTTINDWLTEMLGEGRVRTHVESRLGFLTNIQSIAADVRYVSGHHRLPDVLAVIDRPKWFVFLGLRNPVRHLISHLKWMRALGAPGNEVVRDEHETVVQEMAVRLAELSLNDVEGIHRFINEEFGEAKQFFDNCQVRYLIDYRDRPIEYSDASEAVEALDNLDYVGLSETLADTFAVIARAIGTDAVPVSIPIKNQSLAKETVDLTDPAIRDFYREAVRWDALLYTAAQNRLKRVA